jgi:hypothetical protein
MSGHTLWDVKSALPVAGTIGLTQISGEVGKGIRVGQYLCGEGFKDYEHAFLLGPNGHILQAEPGGARIGNVSEYLDIYWCNQIAALTDVKTLLAIWLNTSARYGPDIETGGKGVGYSFLDYDAIAMHRLHIPAPGLKQYIGDTGHMICSQLVDQGYKDEGVNIFTDRRWPGYVMPGSLYNLDQALLSQKLKDR